MSGKYVTIKALTEEFCEVSEDLVRHWIRHEGLPVHRAGKHLGSQKAKILIHTAEFEGWMSERRRRNKELAANIHPRAREIFEEVKARGWV